MKNGIQPLKVGLYSIVSICVIILIGVGKYLQNSNFYANNFIYSNETAIIGGAIICCGILLITLANQKPHIK